MAPENAHRADRENCASISHSGIATQAAHLLILSVRGLLIQMYVVLGIWKRYTLIVKSKLNLLN